jgi:hypothetical protein
MMPPFGTRNEEPVVHKDDTIELLVYAYTEDEQVVSADDLVTVRFTVMLPDGTTETKTGEVQDDGGGRLLWSDTEQVGSYPYTAQFQFVNGEKKSYRNSFVVKDPFEIIPQTRRKKIAEEVWMRIEDCFDSNYGGPHLRDMTLEYFEPEKVERFIDEGLIYINNYGTITELTLEDFTFELPDNDPALPEGSVQHNPHQILVVQATLIAVIRHLMRSYVEQPAPQGANVVWQDRRDYLQRWQTILQVEWEFFEKLVAAFKRGFFNYGATSLLVHNKAGRLGYMPGFRARNAARGYW